MNQGRQDRQIENALAAGEEVRVNHGVDLLLLLCAVAKMNSKGRALVKLYSPYREGLKGIEYSESDFTLVRPHNCAICLECLRLSFEQYVRYNLCTGNTD